MILTPVTIFQEKEEAAPPAAGLFLDDYPGAEVAFSLRKLRTAYTGDCIRIREGSGNTEADIGFDGSGNVDEAAIASHCAGASGYITKWYDQSGNSYDMVQTSTSNQFRIYDGSSVDTLNGKPTLNGVTGASNYGNAKYLINNSYANTGTQVFGIQVAATGNTTLNNGAFKFGRIMAFKTSAGALDYNTTNQYISLFFQVTSPANTYGAGQNNVFTQPSTNIVPNQQHIMTFNKNGTANAVSIDDPTVGANTATGTISSANLAVTTLWFGRDRSGGVDSHLLGYLQEMIVYNTEQSTDRDSMVSDVNSYWGTY